MNALLRITSLAEALTGLVFAAYPPVLARLLFGARILDAGIIMSRVAGFALIALGIACWPGAAAKSALIGMFTYSILATLYLAYLGLAGGSAGVLLWPAAAAHAVSSVLLASKAFQSSR